MANLKNRKFLEIGLPLSIAKAFRLLKSTLVTGSHFSDSVDRSRPKNLKVAELGRKLCRVVTAHQRQLMISHARREITRDQLLERFAPGATDGAKLSKDILDEALREENAEDVEWGLALGFIFGFTQAHLEILFKLVDADWHSRHEDVVMALDDFRDPQAIDVLYRASSKKLPYLAYNNSSALARKAIYALAKLRNARANEKLQLLAISPDPIVSGWASKVLGRNRA